VPSKKSTQTPKQPQRTNATPPATANIPRNSPVLNQSAALQLGPPINLRPTSSSNRITPEHLQLDRAQAEFAPNAFPSPQHYAQDPDSNFSGNWYDRVLDVLLGEDETLPKNRIVLICQHCKLVNGQAPPGTNSLADLGKWRCFGCGAWNGEEDEGLKAVQEMKEKIGFQVLDQADSEPESTIPEDIGHDIVENTDSLDEESRSAREVEEDESEDEINDSNPTKEPPKGG